MKVLAFAASLRKDSYNRKLIAQAVEILKAMPGLEVDHADYREFEMPIYDGDLEDSSGIPTGGQELIKRVQAADGIVISTPEYNGSIPGTLKNAIDWASRTDPIPFDGKPVLLIGASPGGFGAVRGLWHTRVPFEAMGSFVYPEMFGLPRAHQAFDPSGNFVDAKNKTRLQELIESFLKKI
ncbi:MAG: NADPH-dependent FMN reductase [Bdellovibrionia bacterium]